MASHLRVKAKLFIVAHRVLDTLACAPLTSFSVSSCLFTLLYVLATLLVHEPLVCTPCSVRPELSFS